MELRPVTAASASAQTTRWHAILLAGDRPGGDPLAHAFGVASKSLVPLGGKPMLAHVLQTLLAHPQIGDVFVLAQDPELLFENPALSSFLADPRVRLETSGSGIASSIEGTLQRQWLDWPVLITTSDHVLLDKGTLDWFFDHSADCDVAVGMVDSHAFVADALETKRTWLRFRDVDVTGANLFALNSRSVFPALQYWRSLEANRKKPWRMAWKLGPTLLVSFLLRRLTLIEAFGAAGRKLGVEARPVRIPFARAGVDVDKLADHSLVESMLARQLQ
ncbi:NTP transferase domain-containing protein [Croceibacterium sp. LX-88]|uniref:NTP transferase domain-containing protein n=1 Tax=Croceibacterium selenioxidans TaxID=2838833 RepID=A0ABS5W0T5_9SPHN|nr:nucleotidyltransferase family protein [Croceibacterium selenioxidans]MBT2132840.1 NTP transferase domain-containing protein [Croceibacterium selenioxidans]